MKKIGILGSWHVHTKDYIQQLRAIEGVEITALWDHDVERGEREARNHHLPFVEDLDRFFEGLDAVVCNTETTKHEDYLVKAAQAGLAIFTEKTLATTKAVAEEIAAAIHESGQPFVISFPQIQFAKHQTLSTWLKDGRFGKVSQVYSRNAHNGLTAGWLPEDWMDITKAGGGSLMDLGCHQIYLSLHWFGRPTTVTAYMDVPADQLDDGAATVVLYYAEGPIVTLETSLISQHSPYRLLVHGDEGSYDVENNTVRYHVTKPHGDIAPTENGWDSLDVGSDASTPMQLFVRALNGEEVDLTPFGLGPAVALSEVLEAAYMSHRMSAPIAL